MFGKKHQANFYAEPNTHYAGNRELKRSAKKMIMKRCAQLMAAGMTFQAAMAQAAIDTTTVLAGITDAGTAILAVIGALLALSVSIFGIVKVYKFVSAKAGG